MEFDEVRTQLLEAVHAKELVILIGTCRAEYWGRAASKLDWGSRLVLLKGDRSFALHQNRLLRPANYMMDADISFAREGDCLVMEAKKSKPKESIRVFFRSIEDLHAYPMECDTDLRLFGSEKELSDQLMQDLSFLEPGLKPLNQEEVLRKGMVDILAEDAQKRLVVIELKRRAADYNSVQQLKRYMDQVRNLKGIETRGLLVAPSITKHANELLERYGLEFFHLDFEVGNPRAKIKGIRPKQRTLAEALE